jgi:hypothetical protein
MGHPDLWRRKQWKTSSFPLDLPQQASLTPSAIQGQGEFFLDRLSIHV